MKEKLRNFADELSRSLDDPSTCRCKIFAMSATFPSALTCVKIGSVAIRRLFMSRAGQNRVSNSIFHRLFPRN